MDARQRSWPLILSDYKFLLRCARSIGHYRAAEDIWRSLTKPVQVWRDKANSRTVRSGLAPDTECFNIYLTVKCWRDIMDPIQRKRLRVIPENLVPRNWDKVPYTLAGHRAGAAHGIKGEVSSVVRHMVETGVAENEKPFG
ncbi:hypothetical protein LZ554_006980 [Drepanopeziza brunnea f. sp. 'monogermtubi']|nr:hypothetical protein LZ554_006980 [Drepanopeziza brunnea f. sp. 'monogermtubi']